MTATECLRHSWLQIKAPPKAPPKAQNHPTAHNVDQRLHDASSSSSSSQNSDQSDDDEQEPPEPLIITPVHPPSKPQPDPEPDPEPEPEPEPELIVAEVAEPIVPVHDLQATPMLHTLLPSSDDLTVNFISCLIIYSFIHFFLNFNISNFLKVLAIDLLISFYVLCPFFQNDFQHYNLFIFLKF